MGTALNQKKHCAHRTCEVYMYPIFSCGVVWAERSARSGGPSGQTAGTRAEVRGLPAGPSQGTAPASRSTGQAGSHPLLPWRPLPAQCTPVGPPGAWPFTAVPGLLPGTSEPLGPSGSFSSTSCCDSCFLFFFLFFLGDAAIASGWTTSEEEQLLGSQS